MANMRKVACQSRGTHDRCVLIFAELLLTMEFSLYLPINFCGTSRGYLKKGQERKAKQVYGVTLFFVSFIVV